MKITILLAIVAMAAPVLAQAQQPSVVGGAPPVPAMAPATSGAVRPITPPEVVAPIGQAQAAPGAPSFSGLPPTGAAAAGTMPMPSPVKPK